MILAMILLLCGLKGNLKYSNKRNRSIFKLGTKNRKILLNVCMIVITHRDVSLRQIAMTTQNVDSALTDDKGHNTYKA